MNSGGRAEAPSLTPLGQQIMSQNKSLQKYSPAGTNDPHVRYCDPFGFPANMTNEKPRNDHHKFAESNFSYFVSIHGRVARRSAMDGRALPTNVGAATPGALDPKYNGYSTGHWEDDNTLVVDSTGMDDATWVTAAGYPHTIEAHVQERFTRMTHNDLKLTLTLDDPKIYTKPFALASQTFRWIPNQQLDEFNCIPSQVQEYIHEMGDPAGSDPNAAPQRR